MEVITIKLLEEQIINEIVDNFAANNFPKSREIFLKYLNEQIGGERKIWVAYYNKHVAGYITLKRRSQYSFFSEKNIPEIMDLNVLSPYRSKGIGSRLLDLAEEEAKKISDIVGIGVGLYRDYGNAQRLYSFRGYILDGNGITYNYKQVFPDDKVIVDDDLIIWFTKKLTIVN